jgi:hypothetical protein
MGMNLERQVQQLFPTAASKMFLGASFILIGMLALSLT